MNATISTEAEQLLRTAQQIVSNNVGTDEPLSLAVLHLIRCAADAAAAMGTRDRDTALEILGCARAAVGIATYAIRDIDGDTRGERS